MSNKDKPDSFRTDLESDALSGFKTGQKTGKAFKGKSGEGNTNHTGRHQRRKKRNRHTRATDGAPFEFSQMEAESNREAEQIFDGRNSDDENIYGSAEKNSGDAVSASDTAVGNSKNKVVQTKRGRSSKKDGFTEQSENETYNGSAEFAEEQQPTEYVYGGHNNPTTRDDVGNTTNSDATTKNSSKITDTSGKIAGTNSNSSADTSVAYTSNTSRFKPSVSKTSVANTYKYSGNPNGSSGSVVGGAISEGVSNTGNFISEAYGNTKKAADTTVSYGSSDSLYDTASDGNRSENGEKSVTTFFDGTKQAVKGSKNDKSGKRKKAFSTTTQSLNKAKRFTGGLGKAVSVFTPAQAQTEPSNSTGNNSGENDAASVPMQVSSHVFRGIKVVVDSTIKIIVAVVNFIVSLVTGGFVAAFAGCLPLALIILIVVVIIVVILTVLLGVLASLIGIIAKAWFAGSTVIGSDMYQYAYECAVLFAEEYEAEVSDANKTLLYINGSSTTIPEDGYELEIDYTSAFLIYLAKYETATYADSNLTLTEDSAASSLDSLILGTDENKRLFDEVFEEFCSYSMTRSGTLKLDAYTLYGYADTFEQTFYNSDLTINNLIYLSDAYDVSSEYAVALGITEGEEVSVTIPYIEEVETEAESEEESAEETTEEEETETEAETETETESGATEKEATSEAETETEETEAESTSSSGHSGGGGSSFTQATIG